MESTNFSRWAAAAAFVERWILSSIYVVLMALQIRNLTRLPAAPNYVEVAHVVLMLILNGFIATVLILSRRPSVPPQRARDILVPLLTSFYFLLYALAPPAPPLPMIPPLAIPEPDPSMLDEPFVARELRINQFPTSVQPGTTLVGLGLGLFGPLIALWGVCHLGRSFGVFVTVREVVLRGPYRYVRHPMYLGYICILIGLTLINGSVALFVLVPIHIYLFAFRARLEEERLAESSLEYRRLMEKTGFLFPRFW